MSIDISAINNVGEFYSNHYLDAILDKDVKSLVKSWEDAEGNGYIAPHKRLSAQAAKYFKLKSKLTHSVERLEQYGISHEVNVTLLEALGYEYQSNAYELSSEELLIPVLCSLKKDGNPYLWIIDTYWDLADDARLFDQKLLEVQKPKDTDAYQLQSETLENIPALIFKKDEPPRWLLMLSAGRAVLIERHKWGQGQYLEFDLDEIMARKNIDNFKALAVLLSQEALLPDASNAIHDTLDENSHKHAYAVSSDLKYGIRRAVELLANEYVWYTKKKQQSKGLNREGLDKQLTSETLTYMYRLLFLFYAEARSGDLGLLPMNSDEYRMGYSIESLRDLEQVKLNTEKAKSGYYLNESLEKLFKLINDGHTPTQLELSGSDTVEYAAAQTGVFGTGEVAQGRLKMSPSTSTKKAEKQYTDYEFSIEALGSPLFDPAKTPLLSKAKYRNVVLQEIIQLLSLSKEGRGRKSGRGRISYAQLGINQLGAVYEGLLSYTGFFAKETLYEVKKADDKSEDENRQGYFIPESEIDKYNEDEFVCLKDSDNPTAAATRVKYDKGTFIYRLAGRDREKSASYYTPEVLTKVVVKYSLKELLKDKEADEILKLTVCEPAMGSGAFLNEAVNQLADAYLQEKQTELGRDIPPADYQEELQRVKAYIATHNCYGVDLNPTAVDLAKVSLWLNIIYKHSKTPWFNLRLSSGNSLIGARLQVYKTSDLKSKRSKDIENYLDMVPQKVDLKVGRAADEIYHFFVPDPGMAGFDKDNVIKGLLPDEVAKIKEWRKSFTKEFTEPQIQTLQRLSIKVDELLARHLELRQRLLRETTDDTIVWPAEGKPSGSNIPVKEKLEQEIYEGSSAYRKLKLVMDYWCSLWFWPIENAKQLPTRDQYIRDCELILEGKTSGRGAISNQTGLAFKPVGENEIAEPENIDEYGIDRIVEQSFRLKIVSDVSTNTPFMHWELQYLEIFRISSGFDLILGNPPWVKVEWKDSHIISDHLPIVALRGADSDALITLREKLFLGDTFQSSYTEALVSTLGYQAFISSQSIYETLRGVKPNLYKNFIFNSWSQTKEAGVSAFITDRGIFSEPDAANLRCEAYPRLTHLFMFANEKRLFSDVGNEKRFEIQVYGPHKNQVSFESIANLFHPITIDLSYASSGSGIVPGIKNSTDGWEINGHKDRIIRINESNLAFFSNIYDGPNSTALKAKFPTIHAKQFITILKTIHGFPKKLHDLDKYATKYWQETSSQTSGVIKKQTIFPKSIMHLIVSGPHFYVSNPFQKTPKIVSNTHRAFDAIDLQRISEDYLPRTKFVPACSDQEFIKKSPKISWDNEPANSCARVFFSEMLNHSAERSLQPALFPPGPSHIHTIMSVAVKDVSMLLPLVGNCSSLLYDMFIRILGKGHLYISDMEYLPNISIQEVNARALILNCLTSHYKEIWKSSWNEKFKHNLWTKSDNKLRENAFTQLRSKWKPEFPLKSDYERRQALLEIDVLVAIHLGLSFQDLVVVFRSLYPVYRYNEKNTWYDQNGRIVFTTNKNMTNIGVSRSEWENIKNMKNGDYEKEIIDETLTTPKENVSIVYMAPFAGTDREADYRIAWDEFEKRLSRK
jgi:hypothetical protein